MAVEQPKLAIFDEAVGVLQIGFACSNGLYLGSGQNDARFEFFEQEVVMTRVPVYGGIFLSRGGGLPARIFLTIWLDLMGRLLGHAD